MNQINPFIYRTREDTVRRCAELGIAVEAWAPLSEGTGWATPRSRPSRPRPGGRRPRCSSGGRCRRAALDSLDEGLTTDWDPETMA